jgi:YfiH family protein
MRQAWLESVGLDSEAIVVAHQVHGAGIANVSASDAGRGARPGSRSIAQADALVTHEVGVVLMTLHADCMAILLCDPVRRVIATIHAGWRGTVTGVTAESVKTMITRYGSYPTDLIAYLGPAIGPCCYEVGADVVDGWRAARIDPANTAIQASIERPDRWAFDLEAANRLMLVSQGVPESNFESSGICTRCEGNGWFSHRGQGPHTGRYGSFIALTEPVSEVVQRV